MAINIRAEKVFTSTTTSASASAVKAVSTALARVPAVSGVSVVTQVARPFNVVEELLHDGGQDATWHNSDMLIPASSFRALLTTNESNYVAAHHPTFLYYAIPYDLVEPGVENDPVHVQTRDNNFRATMAGFVAQYGFANMYLIWPEWDNDPPNLYWTHNRFLENCGSTGTPNHPLSSNTRQQVYDQFIHFYTANNHNGILDHHQLGQILSVPSATRGYKVCTMNVFVGNVKYSFDMGVDQVVLERNNDDISGLVGAMAIIRGAGSQNGKQWGIDISHSRTWGPSAGVTSYTSSGAFIAGWTNPTYRRHFYLSYFGGADIILLEGVNMNTNGNVNLNGRFYTPLASEIRSFNDFAFNRHTQRGVQHVPVAVMQDHIVSWEPRYGQFNQGRNLWYNVIPCNAGENMMHNMWDWMYPNYATWGSSTTASEPWGSGRWGEQFDVVTERITASTMGNYRSIILSTNAVVDATLQAKLDTYVRAGGVVVINAKQLTGTAHESLTGVHLVGTASTSGTVTYDGDASTFTEPTFNYATCTLGTATNLFHSGASTTQVAKNVLGSGEVWTVMPDYMSNPANSALLGIGNKIIDVLISRYAIAWITGGNHINIDFCITKQAGVSGAATVVTIANTSNGNVNWTGTVNFPGTSATVREWVADVTPTFTQIGGNTQVSAAVSAGDVRVYAVG